MHGIVNKVYFICLIILFNSQNIYCQQTKAVGVDSIIIKFTQAPTPASVSVKKAALKYNKDFALSMQIDDGDLSIVSHGFPVFEGGDITGTIYPGMEYSDGCGNIHNFKMSSAIFPFNRDGLNEPDVHNDNAYGQLTWEELDLLFQNNWGILNHGVNSNADTDSAFMHYSISRNKSYIRRKLLNSTPGGVLTRVFVNPNGKKEFTQPAFDLGNIGALNQRLTGPIGFYGGNVNNPSVDWAQAQNLFRHNADLTNVVRYVRELADSSSNGANYWGSIFTHSVISSYLFDSFRSDFNFISATYGINGLDNIFMASEEEILDYLKVRDAIEVNYDLINQGTGIRIKYTGNVPVDLLYYSTSLNISSDAEIDEIIIYGTNDYNHSGTGNDSVLINLNWNGYVVPDPEELADNYTALALNTQSQYDCYVAMDYVITLDNSQHKDSLRQLLCAIPNSSYDDGFCLCDIEIQPVDTIIQSGSCIELIGATGDFTYQWLIGDSLIDSVKDITTCPELSTVYTHIATNRLGCPAEDSIIVSTLLLDFSLGSDTTLCQRNCIDLNGPGGMDAYEWIVSDTVYATTSSITVCPLDTTKYKLIITEQNLQSSDSIYVNVNPIPIVSLGNDTSILKTDSIILYGPDPGINDSYTYLWSTGETTKNIAPFPLDSTNYSLSVTNIYGCSNSDSLWVWVYERPIITESQAFFIAENLSNGEIVGTVLATDVDEGTIFQDWSIVSGNVNNTFGIIDSTGVLTVVDSSEINYEQYTEFLLGITVSDGIISSDTTNITIYLSDVNDNKPVIDSNQVFMVFEKSFNMAILDTVKATDVDEDSSFIDWNIVSGNTNNAFFINDSTAIISVADSSYLDYETQRSYFLGIIVSDGLNISDTVDVRVNIANVNDMYISNIVLKKSYCIEDSTASISFDVNEFVPPLSFLWTTGDTIQNLENILTGNYVVIITDSTGFSITQSFVLGIETVYNETEICYVSSDTTDTWYNKIYLNKGNYYNVDKFVIYRSMNNINYNVIGEIQPDEYFFIDSLIDNRTTKSRYRAGIRDSCGNFSSLGQYHETIHLTGDQFVENNINLSWNNYQGVDYSLYNIYRSVNNENFKLISQLPSANNSYTDTDVDPTNNLYKYYISIIINDSCGINESPGIFPSTPTTTIIRSNLLTLGNLYINSTIMLETGWNIISLNQIPDNLNMLNILDPLISSGSLIKCLNEREENIQFYSGVGWINNIGDISNSEGYHLQLSKDDSLINRGLHIDLPYTIELTAGWNIMSYPHTISQPAHNILQTLINYNTVIKVINEKGDIIQNIPGIGWINTIVDFDPGEGYYISVTNNTSLILTDSKPGPINKNKFFYDVFDSGNSGNSNIDIQNKEKSLDEIHLIQNPYKPMNIIFYTGELVGFTPQEGDLFLAFDGDLCVGVVEVNENDTIINLAATAIEGDSKGFTPGNSIRLQYYSITDNEVYNIHPEEIYLGEMIFQELGSLYARFNKSSLSAEDIDKNMILHIYPNPVSQELYIELSYLVKQANKTIRLEIINLEGKQFINKNIPAGQTTDNIKVNLLPSGIYQLIITAGRNQHSQKFVKL